MLKVNPRADRELERREDARRAERRTKMVVKKCKLPEPSESIWFVIPRVPTSLNKMLRKHWAVRAKEQSAWDDEIFVAVSIERRRQWANLIFKADGKPYLPVQVEIKVVWKSRRLDPDGLAASVKPILDAMRKICLIYNDSPRWITLVPTQTMVSHAGGKPRTEICVRCVRKALSQ